MKCPFQYSQEHCDINTCDKGECRLWVKEELQCAFMSLAVNLIPVAKVMTQALKETIEEEPL